MLAARSVATRDLVVYAALVGLTAIDRAGLAIVAVERSARLAYASLAGLGAVADAAIRARRAVALPHKPSIASTIAQLARRAEALLFVSRRG